MESVILLFVDVDDTSDHKLLQAQIDNYLGRDTVSVEAVVVESIKSDVLQVSTPPPLTSFTISLPFLSHIFPLVLIRSSTYTHVEDFDTLLIAVKFSILTLTLHFYRS